MRVGDGDGQRVRLAFLLLFVPLIQELAVQVNVQRRDVSLLGLRSIPQGPTDASGDRQGLQFLHHVPGTDMRDLVPQGRSQQVIVASDQRQQSRREENVAARDGVRVDRLLLDQVDGARPTGPAGRRIP